MNKVKRPRKTRTNGTSNRSRNKKAGREVGAVVPLVESDVETIEAARQHVTAVQSQLGAELERHRNAEAQLMAALKDANERYRQVVITLAQKHDIPTENSQQRWNLDEDTGSFTRTA